MKIHEMTEEERHTFGALVRLMVGADGSTSLEESTDLQEAADQLGSDEFWKVLRETAGKDYGTETIQARARAIQRREVQETIYGVLFTLATAGSIMGGEADLLAWLAETWDLETSSPEDD